MKEQRRQSGALLSPQEMWILSSLAESPKHGYAIAKQVEELTEGQISLSAATLYGNIHRMLESGLIERVDEYEIQAGKTRKRYKATGLGEKVLRDHARIMRKADALIPHLLALISNVLLPWKGAA